MKKIFTITTVLLMVCATCVLLASCGIADNPTDGVSKMEAAGYTVTQGITVDTTGKYQAFSAVKGESKLIIVYFDVESEKEGSAFCKDRKHDTLVMTVRYKKTKDYYVVYYGADDAIKVFEK